MFCRPSNENWSKNSDFLNLQNSLKKFSQSIFAGQNYFDFAIWPKNWNHGNSQGFLWSEKNFKGSGSPPMQGFSSTKHPQICKILIQTLSSLQNTCFLVGNISWTRIDKKWNFFSLFPLIQALWKRKVLNIKHFSILV